jgi:tetratricopeptide (TPR) repeat protein
MRKSYQKIIVRKYAVIAAGVLFFGTVDTPFGGSGFSDEVLRDRRWHDLHASRSLINNPSFAALVDRLSVALAASTMRENHFLLINGQLVIPVSSTALMSQSIGISYTGLSTGKFEQTHWDGIQLIETGSGNNLAEHYGTITYALKPFSFMTAGMNINFVKLNYPGLPVYDGSFDVGVSVVHNNAPAGGKQVCGVTVLNPTGFSIHESSAYTPELGVSWSFSKPLNIAASAMVINAGVELYFRGFDKTRFNAIDKGIRARTGINYRMVTCYLHGGKNYAGISFTMCLDSVRNSVSTIWKNTEKDEHRKIKSAQGLHNLSAAFQLLYAKNPIEEPIPSLYLSGEYGKTRRRDEANCADFYIEAMKRYNAEKYWDAYGYFSSIEQICPHFAKIHKTRIRTALCLEQLGQDSLAMEQYILAKIRHEASKRNNAKSTQPIMEDADLGLLRLYALSDEVDSVTAYYEKLIGSPANDSVKNSGRYTYGLFLMRHGSHAEAIRILNVIPHVHPDFGFAQNAKGICQFVTGAADEEIETSFDKAIRWGEQMKNTPERELIGEIVSKSRYDLACFHYEQSRNKQKHQSVDSGITDDSLTLHQGIQERQETVWSTLELLSKIPSESAYGTRALHLAAWLLYREHYWKACVVIIREFEKSKTIDDAYITADMKLLKARILISDEDSRTLGDNRRAEAFAILDTAEKMMMEWICLLNNDIGNREHVIDSLESLYHATIMQKTDSLLKNSKRKYIDPNVVDSMLQSDTILCDLRSSLKNVDSIQSILLDTPDSLREMLFTSLEKRKKNLGAKRDSIVRAGQALLKAFHEHGNGKKTRSTTSGIVSISKSYGSTDSSMRRGVLHRSRCRSPKNPRSMIDVFRNGMLPIVEAIKAVEKEYDRAQHSISYIDMIVTIMSDIRSSTLTDKNE